MLPSALAVFPVLAAASAGAPPCPAQAPVAGADGLVEVAPLPSPRAQTLNNEGKALYRQGSFPAARARYRAALDADPAFLAPALNLACAFAREERHADAAREAAALIRRAFVPWGREVMEAADLAVLHVRPEMSLLRAARAEAALRWGQALEGTLLFVARVRPPVRPRGQGVLTLGLQQEIFAWSPRTGRLHQVTADDGRVLAFARALDGRSLVYVRGGKLVREAGPGARPPRLRGLALVRLDLTSMAATPALDLPGDVAALELWPPAGTAVELRVTAAADAPARVFRAAGTALEPAPSLSPAAAASAPAVRLDGRGVTGRAAAPAPAGAGACRFRAADDFSAGKPAQVLVHPAGRARRPFPLTARYGAGLHGLPFDDDASSPISPPK